MSLHNGLDIMAIASHGVYSSTYITSTGGSGIATLFASFGLLETASEYIPPSGPGWVKKMFDWFWEFF